MIKQLGLPDLPSGVSGTSGMCGNEHDHHQSHPFPAYNLNSNAMITVASTEVFPNGFPEDFSILLTLRPKRSIRQAPLFTMYSSLDEKVLELSVGEDILLHYQDLNGSPLDDDVYTFDTNINDDK